MRLIQIIFIIFAVSGDLSAKGKLPDYEVIQESRGRLFKPLFDALKQENSQRTQAQSRINTRRTLASKPYSVFENPRDPYSSPISLAHATKASFVHPECQGEGMKIAVIEMDFEENVFADFSAHLDPKVWDLWPTLLPSIENECSHGNWVLEAVHKTAPKATLIPIPFTRISKDRHSDDLEKSIDIAINHKVDAITMSVNLLTTSEDRQIRRGKAFKKARDAGIAIFLSSGNESSQKEGVRYLDWVDWKNKKPGKTEATKTSVAYIIEALEGRGVYAVGSVGYDPQQAPITSPFTSIPSPFAEQTELYQNAFLLAPGERLSLGGERHVQGTSFSSPAAAACYALLKQYAKKHNIPHVTFDDLMVLLKHSGNPVLANHWGLQDEAYMYITIDLHHAFDLLDQRFLK